MPGVSIRASVDLLELPEKAGLWDGVQLDVTVQGCIAVKTQ